MITTPTRWMLAGAVLCVVVAGSVFAGDDAGQLVRRGALLYDKWYALTGAAPQGNHPLYPASGRKKGATTWRCKECHGWDYLGRDGRYATGSHATGIKGVYDARDLTTEEVLSRLSGGLPGHDFSAYLGAADRRALAAFLRTGLVDWRELDGVIAGTAGDRGRGRQLYAAHCSGCHGDDGQALDFKGKKEGVQGVGWLARKNPQESLHKIRWGHPGSDMPSMKVDAGLDDQACIDILSYCRNLP